jgi:hypothetical protein
MHNLDQHELNLLVLNLATDSRTKLQERLVTAAIPTITEVELRRVLACVHTLEKLLTNG